MCVLALRCEGALSPRDRLEILIRRLRHCRGPRELTADGNNDDDRGSASTSANSTRRTHAAEKTLVALVKNAAPVACARLARSSSKPIGATIPTSNGEWRYELGEALVTTSDASRVLVARDDAEPRTWTVRAVLTDTGGRAINTHADEMAAVILSSRVINAPTIAPGLTGKEIQVAAGLAEDEANEISVAIR